MADLVVGLAKSVVEGALTKAQEAIEEEAKLRQGAKRDLVFITGEFRMMQSFLNVANEERVENKVVRTWVTQVRELAYDVEDCIELVVHLDKKTSLWLRMIPSCMAPPLPLDEALEEIEQLKARVKDVSKRNARYSLISDTGSKPIIVQQQPATGAAVGGAITTSNMLAEARDAAKRQQVLGGDLTQLITTDDADEVISVWGTGGDHGITSTVMKTYTDAEICQNFTYRAWVKLKQPFVPHDFVLSLMAQFYASSSWKGKQERATIGMHVLTKMQATQEDHLFEEFERIVTKERYLIVLEGLSSMVDWHSIRTFLPHGKNGSRIIVSTHQSELATLCIGHSYQILELKQFSAEQSVCVLFNKGSSGDADKGKKPIVDSSLVGRGSQMNELHKYSAKARMSPSKVMSVWGIAGVGKSALVGDLYNDLRNKDDTRQPQEKQYKEYHWVNVSHPFNLRDFCRSILSDFHSGKDPIEECHRLLKQNRCLVVIDDIHSKKDWELIKTSLLPRSSDSVIIVITTDAGIATYCANNKELVFNVKGLEAAAAFDLFKQEVRKRLKPDPSSDPSSSVDWSEAVEVKELILKCGGLPKVIVAIACALAKQTVTRMDTILSLNRKFMHHLETKPDYDGLGDLFAWMHSYFRTCPDSLKPCIFYSAIFPQEQIIRRRRLVRRWIAEGYSRDGDDISAEENGEQQFSELLDLSIMQQVPQLVTTTEFSDKRMAMCKVNGFIREYIIPLRKEENLVFELVGNCALTTQRTGRHLVITDDWDRDRIVFESIDFSRLRSLTVFGKWESFFISESMKLLRVLDLEDASEVEYDDLKKMVKWLRRLKFLSLRGRQEIYHLPSSLDHLRQLQTLDVRGTSIVTLPRSITKLQKLQYIRAGTIVPVALAPLAQSSCFCRSRCTVGVEVPRGIGELTALHTLGVVDVNASGGKAILEELEKLTQLRKLGVSGINKHNSKKFLSVIQGHGHLESLSVQLDKDNQGCLAGISLPLDNLQSLKLYGLENGLPLPSNQFTRLRKLALEMDTLMQNDIDFLANLPELCILRLRVKQQLQGGRLHFYAEMSGEQLVTFEKVKILEIACSSSELQVTFGSKSMRNLELLKIDYSRGTSYQLVGMNNLSELKQVLLKGTNDEEFRTQFASHLANHPNRPVVKLEELPRSS